MLARLLPALTLAVGLLGTLAAVGGERPWFVAWFGLGLVVAGVIGVEEGREPA